MLNFTVLVLALDGDSGEDFTVQAPDEAGATAAVLQRFKVKTEDELQSEHGLRISHIFPERI